MGKSIFYIIYLQPLYRIVELMVLGIFIWIQLRAICRRDILWRVLNGIMGIVALCAIAKVTLFSERQWTSEVIIIPFYAFIEAKSQPEIYRTMLMNVFLFFPVGLTVPYVLPVKWKKKVLISILFAILLSSAIEVAQYYWHIGRAEVDDVICNSLGSAIGTISYCLAKKIELPDGEC